MDLLQKKLITPLLAFLQQGLSPEKLALCVALGITLGTFPMLGATTLLCTAAAVSLRLNMPAIQLVNYFAYPLQLILFIPFIRAGEFIFQETPVSLDLALIFTMLQSDLLGTIRSLWWTNVRGMIAWGIIAAPVGFFVYRLLKKIFTQIALAQRSNIEG